MNRNLRNRLIFGAAVLLLAACGGEYTPRTGDLLFQLTAAEGMTDAIVAATEPARAAMEMLPAIEVKASFSAVSMFVEEPMAK